MPIKLTSVYYLALVVNAAVCIEIKSRNKCFIFDVLNNM